MGKRKNRKPAKDSQQNQKEKGASNDVKTKEQRPRISEKKDEVPVDEVIKQSKARDRPSSSSRSHSSHRQNRDSSKGNTNSFSADPYTKQQDRKSRSSKLEDNRQFEDASNTIRTSTEENFDQFYYALKQRTSRDVYTKVTEIEEDLFNMPVEYSLAHCVAEDMNMGSGIAVRFCQQFKRRDELYSQRQRQGGLAVLDDKDRYIYYLVTKRLSNGKPTLETMWRSLQKLRQHVEENRVKKLAVPRIGCGLDRLEWSTVKYMLEYTFRNTDVQITVCNYQQSEDTNPTSSSNRKANKCPLRNVRYPLAEIESGTAILYFGTEDGFVSDDLQDLDKKFGIIRDYKIATKRSGDTLVAFKHSRAYLLCGCIVRKTKNDPFDFVSLQKCLTKFRKENRNYYYVAFQAFLDPSDDLIVTKIGNVLRHFLRDVEVYVCWGGNMNDYMPQPTNYY